VGHMPPRTSREERVGHEELLGGSEARISPSSFTRSSIECCGILVPGIT